MIHFNKKLIIFLIIFLLSFLAIISSPIKVSAVGLSMPGGVVLPGNPIPPNPTGPAVLPVNPLLAPYEGSTNVGGNMNLPTGALQSAQDLVKALNSPPKAKAPEPIKSITCNCVLDLFCALKCFVLDIFSGIGQAMVSISSGLLSAVINGTITGSLGFSASDNFVIAIGWGIVRNVANAALVIGLVWIAISIILGRENKAKNTLINFIIIALLINFTPVICSFIIDGANIITNSFMSGGVSAKSYQVGIETAFETIKIGDKMDFGSQIVYAVILLLFSIFFSVVLLLYCILFLARIIILWILVIVSPIAFATKVFPKFKHLNKIFPSILSWDEWWGSFWQWCVIGIPAGMSIYLANKLLTIYASSDLTTSLSVFNPTAWLAFLFSYTLPFAFLLVGFFISVSTGTEAAQSLSSELTNWGRKGAGFIGNKTAGAAVGVAGAGVGAAAWMMTDQSKNSPSSPYVSAGEAMKAGFGKGYDTYQKEGVIGTADKAVGSVAGAAIGAKNWMKRDPDSKASFGDYVEYGARKGFKDGGVGTIAGAVGSTAGTIAGGVAGAGAGAVTGAVKAAWNGEDISKGIKEGLVEGAKEGAKTGGTIASSLGVKIGQAGVNTVKEVTSTMYEKVVKIDEKGDKDKRDAEKAKKAAKRDLKEEEKWKSEPEKTPPAPPAQP